MDLNVNSVLDEVTSGGTSGSSMSVMQLPEKHNHQWHGGVSKELRRAVE